MASFRPENPCASGPGSVNDSNPLLSLAYEPVLESLGGDYHDQVSAADFPSHLLRFRNDAVLRQLGLDPALVEDEHFIEAFGQFKGRRPLLALRYHGYQFGTYNPGLGDGRGFLHGQVRGMDGALYDFGTKGSGTTPYSRTADGRLTLKGGIREVLAAEALHHMGVRTSRCMSLIETGEALWRGDEPSPTRSSVMVRFSRSHIRFGSFERLHYFGRKDLVRKLLDHVIDTYYPAIANEPDRDGLFYRELVRRVAELAAEWMAAGFCHGVLNTDNMSIVGESFDYGPYAFIDRYDPGFTAAYFDYFGQYSYGNQPRVCYWNLGMLQQPLALVMPIEDLDSGLHQFTAHYDAHYQTLMLGKLGFEQLSDPLGEDLVRSTLDLLEETRASYPAFFVKLTNEFAAHWREDDTSIFGDAPEQETGALVRWRGLYQRALAELSSQQMQQVGERLRILNPQTTLLRPRIEAVWEQIAQEDNWKPFQDLVADLGRNDGS